MKRKRGAPTKAVKKTEPLQVRAEPAEKEGFTAAANLAGISRSAWMRERLRTAARSELSKAGKSVPF
jgi:hypothetical protein